MTDRYGEAVWAAVESDGQQTTQKIKSELGIGYNDAARFTERMVADGIISECDKAGRRTLLKNFCGCCEACTAPLFEDDDYLVDEGGSSICKPAVEIVGPCYAGRIGGLDASADTHAKRVPAQPSHPQPTRQERRVMDELDDFDNGDCWNCGGEGWVANCFDEVACLYPDEGCDLCTRRCDICRAALRARANPSLDGGAQH